VFDGVEGDVAIVRMDEPVEPGVTAREEELSDGTMLDPDGAAAARLTFPVRPRLPRDKLDVAEVLATRLVGFVGEALTVKSDCTLKVIDVT